MGAAVLFLLPKYLVVIPGKLHPFSRRNLKMTICSLVSVTIILFFYSGWRGVLHMLQISKLHPGIRGLLGYMEAPGSWSLPTHPEGEFHQLNHRKTSNFMPIIPALRVKGHQQNTVVGSVYLSWMRPQGEVVSQHFSGPWKQLQACHRPVLVLMTSLVHHSFSNIIKHVSLSLKERCDLFLHFLCTVSLVVDGIINGSNRLQTQTSKWCNKLKTIKL